MTDNQISRDVVVLEEDCEQYRPLLVAAGIEARYVTEPTQVGDAEILLASPNLAAGIVGRLPSLRWIQSTWAGVDELSRVGGLELVTLTGLKEVFGPQMREFVFGHLLAHTQRVASRMAAQTWDELVPSRLEGSTLGIIGTGSIGSAIAETGQHFGMRVVGLNRSGRPARGFDVVYTDPRRFAGEADNLVAVLPSTVETDGLVDATFLNHLKRGAVFINVGRGSTVDTAAVVSALGSGRLSLAVLDVLPAEPLVDGDPLWAVPGLVITSHTAAWSRPKDVVAVFVRNLARWTADEPLEGLIDPVSGY